MADGVTVLLPVLDGAAFLAQQLDSLAGQSHPPKGLILSDDGSRDGSLRIAQRFARTARFEVQVRAGPGQGYAQNIAALLRAAPAGAVAFCDQDDVWMPDRLARAAQYLAPLSRPALFVSGRSICGPRLDHPRPPPLPGATAFRMALTRNRAPANATVLNPAAARLARDLLPPDAALPPFPDWWIFALVLGAGGTVIFDPQPGLLYRQHRGNLLGARRRRRLRRLRYLADGTYGRWLGAQTQALLLAEAALTPTHRQTLHHFARALDRFWPMAVMTGAGKALPPRDRRIVQG